MKKLKKSRRELLFEWAWTKAVDEWEKSREARLAHQPIPESQLTEEELAVLEDCAQRYNLRKENAFQRFWKRIQVAHPELNLLRAKLLFQDLWAEEFLKG